MRQIQCNVGWVLWGLLVIDCSGQASVDGARTESSITIETNAIVGVGLVLATSDGNYAIVQDVIKPGPAENAGISKGDKILFVNGKSTLDMHLKDAVSRLRGEAQSQIEITFEHLGSPKTVLLTRQKLAPGG